MLVVKIMRNMKFYIYSTAVLILLLGSCGRNADNKNKNALETSRKTDSAKVLPVHPTTAPRDTTSPAVLQEKNYLVNAVCVFATPGWGDGKNGDDSFVDVIAKVQSGANSYEGKGVFLNNTEIEANTIRDMGIGFTENDSKNITYDDISNIKMDITWNKPNEGGMNNDHWEFRYEFVLTFKNGQVLSTGGSDPAFRADFWPTIRRFNGKTDFKRSELVDHRGMINPPIG
jgi:hypothetical protein